MIRSIANINNLINSFGFCNVSPSLWRKLKSASLFHPSVYQCDDKDFRGPSWRRQFPPRDVHGISMMPGSAETLPAGFRLTATSGHSRRLPPEGKRPGPRASPPDLIHPFGWLLSLQGFVLFYTVHWRIQNQTYHLLVKWKQHAWAQESLLPAVLWPCLLFSPTLWRLLCSPLWGAGRQSWRHVFGLVSRSAMPHWRSRACRPCVFYDSTYTPLLLTHGLCQPLSCCISPSPQHSLSLCLSLPLSTTLESLCYPTPRVLFCRVAKYSCTSRPGGKKLRGSSYGLGPMLAGCSPWSYRVKAAKQKKVAERCYVRWPESGGLHRGTVRLGCLKNSNWQFVSFLIPLLLKEDTGRRRLSLRDDSGLLQRGFGALAVVSVRSDNNVLEATDELWEHSDTASTIWPDHQHHVDVA